MDKVEEIRGCKHKDKQQEPHTCPFLDDVHDDKETLCTCCPDCEQDCCDDI